jgi:hypothetical protein
VDQIEGLVNYYEVLFVKHIALAALTPADMVRATGKVGEGSLTVSLAPGKYDILLLAGYDIGSEKILLGTAFGNNGIGDLTGSNLNYNGSGTGFEIKQGANIITIMLTPFEITEGTGAGGTGIIDITAGGSTTFTPAVNVERSTTSPYYPFVNIPNDTGGLGNDNVLITLPADFFGSLSNLVDADIDNTSDTFTVLKNEAKVRYYRTSETNPPPFPIITATGAPTSIDTSAPIDYTLANISVKAAGNAAGTFYFDLTYRAFGLDTTQSPGDAFDTLIDTWHIRNAIYGDNHPDTADAATPTKGGMGGAILLFFGTIGSTATVIVQ